MVDIIEIPLNVKVYDPVRFSAVYPNRFQCLVSIPIRSVTIRMWTEYLLEPWLQVILNNHLCHPVTDSRYSKPAEFIAFLGYLNLLDRWGDGEALTNTFRSLYYGE